MRIYRPHRSLTEQRAFLGQNDVLKLLGFILIGLFTWQLAGCGGSSSSSPIATATPTATATATPTATATATPTATPTATATATPVAYSVGGTVSGLSGSSVTLINNEIDALTVSSNGPYTFSLTSAGPGVYSVLIAAQPPGQVCTVANGTGVITNASITNVNVACATGPEQIVHAFAGGTDGNYPDSGLTLGSDDNFYGTTSYGGAHNLGTVYRMTPAGVHTVLYSFAGGPGDGQYPASGLDRGDDGAFYATTTAGGAYGSGTFFRITLAGTETMLYSFGAIGSGATPQGLTLLDGNFYGTTSYGGAHNLGTVYRMTPAGVHTVLYSFAGGSDGERPVAGLSDDSDGNLYGVTYYGGTNNFGTIFRIAPDGTGYTTLHSFAGEPADGEYPGVKLRDVSSGTLYGSTGAGGANGLGTIFTYDPSSGVTSVIYSFAGAPGDGNQPSSRLRVGNDGKNLYGVTFYGGYFDSGTFFQITPAGVLSVLYSFAGGSDGQSPSSSLLLTPDGTFYGTTVTGGPTSNGTIYQIKP
jgi:uncharacterized repeat protein (TIGR03803 family)